MAWLGPGRHCRAAASGRAGHRRTPRPGNNKSGRRVEIYRARGITLLVDNGTVTRAIHSSAGKRGYETPRGSYRIQHKVLKDWSRPYKTWMRYASYWSCWLNC